MRSDEEGGEYLESKNWVYGLWGVAGVTTNGV